MLTIEDFLALDEKAIKKLSYICKPKRPKKRATLHDDFVQRCTKVISKVLGSCPKYGSCNCTIILCITRN